MALRLRRGTDAERQLITPLEGELIYTTDTKLLYVGDGTTVGGTLVTGAGGGGSTTLDALTDTNLAGAANGDVLAYNSGTNQWEPVEVSVGGSTTLDALTDTNLAGAADGDLLAYNSETNQWEPVEVPGLIALSLIDLDDVVVDGDTILPGHVLTWDETGIWTSKPIATVFEEQQNYKINIVGDDSTIIINGDTNDVTGNFFGDLSGNVSGNVRGDLTGSVFGDDSTLLVDGINGTVSGLLLGDVDNNNVTTRKLQMVGPLHGIDIETEGTISDNYSLFTIKSYHNSTDSTGALYLRGRGSITSQLPIQAGDSIFHNYSLGLTAAGPLPSGVIEMNTDPNGIVSSSSVPGEINLKTWNDAGAQILGLGLNRNGEITVADNTLTAGASSGQVDNSAVVRYLQITVGTTTYAMPLYAINP